MTTDNWANWAFADEDHENVKLAFLIYRPPRAHMFTHTDDSGVCSSHDTQLRHSQSQLSSAI